MSFAGDYEKHSVSFFTTVCGRCEMRARKKENVGCTQDKTTTSYADRHWGDPAYKTSLAMANCQLQLYVFASEFWDKRLHNYLSKKKLSLGYPVRLKRVRLEKST